MAETEGTSHGQASYRHAPRRRGAVLERAICEAALAELAEVGYLNFSLERVAHRARTGNASIYRRWHSRAQLLLDALSRTLPEAADLPDTGQLRQDLLELLRRLAARQAGPAGEVMRGVLIESAADKYVRAARGQLTGFWAEQVLEVLRRGAGRGEVSPDALDPVVA